MSEIKVPTVITLTAGGVVVAEIDNAGLWNRVLGEILAIDKKDRETPVSQINESCQQVMKARKKPYPRTCLICGLGPCNTPPVLLAALAGSEVTDGR